MLIKFPSIPSLLSVVFFLLKWYWILSYSFSASVEMIMLFFSILLMWHITLVEFYMLNHPCSPVINPTWLWYIVIVVCCWSQFASVLWRIFFFFNQYSSGILVSSFLLCLCLALLLVLLASLSKLGNVFSSLIFWKCFKRIGVNSSLNIW